MNVLDIYSLFAYPIVDADIDLERLILLSLAVLQTLSTTSK